jgi:hypothetical protein
MRDGRDQQRRLSALQAGLIIMKCSIVLQYEMGFILVRRKALIHGLIDVARLMLIRPKRRGTRVRDLCG